MVAGMYQVTKELSVFWSWGTRCTGDLYRPMNCSDPPVIVMAHGLSFERTFGLPAFAEYFASRGLAVYLFDYRCFGDSEGEPRNLVDPTRHIQDWQAAIAHIRSLPYLNASKLALWGTSFSAGHVAVVAGQDHQIAAISLQVPFLDPISTIRKLGMRYVLQALPHALRDIGRMLTMRHPYYVSAIGSPQEFAVVNTVGSLAKVKSLIPAGVNWQNCCPARILVAILAYRPKVWVRKITCPALVIYGEQDNLIDAQSIKSIAAQIRLNQIVSYPVGHFDLYQGEYFQQVVKLQADFLMRNLGIQIERHG